MKQAAITNWVAQIQNAFSVSLSFLSAFPPLKGIGDELMYFIEDADLQQSGYNYLQIYDALFQIACSNAPGSIPATKIVAAYCPSAYAMTFLKGKPDYYGADIDRTARLKSVRPPLQSREIVVDDQLHLRILSDYRTAGNQPSFQSVMEIQGPHKHKAKGIPKPVLFYRAMASRTVGDFV